MRSNRNTTERLGASTAIFSALVLASLFLACASPTPATPDLPELPELPEDERYLRSIDFEPFDFSVPLRSEGHYLRIDGPVDDIVAHTDKLIEELGFEGATVTLSNLGRYGRQMTLEFADGKVCSFIWVASDESENVEQARLQHEKYHALCRLEPSAIPDLSERIGDLGYTLNLGDYEEELAATVVEVLTLYELGSEFVFGTGVVNDAITVLEEKQDRGRRLGKER